MAKAALSDGVSPMFGQHKNLVVDGRFELVDQRLRNDADQSDQVVIDGGKQWSPGWAVTGGNGNNVELLGKGWFDKMDKSSRVGFSVGWPPDGLDGVAIRFAVNPNGQVHYGEMSQTIRLRKGTVNVNFLAVRNNFGNCGKGDGTYNVILKKVNGSDPLTHTVTDRGRGVDLHGPDGHWVRHSFDWKIEADGSYIFTIEGVRNDVIDATCGSFITDIFLGYRSTPHVSNVEGAEGTEPYRFIRAKAEQHFPPLSFLLVDTEESALLRNHEVTLEIRDPEASGIHFEKGDRAKFVGRTNGDGVLTLGGRSMMAGAKPETTGQLVVVIDGTEIYKLGLRVEARAPIVGVAASVERIPSSYSSGDEQNAISRTRFSRPLKVAVSDVNFQSATTGEVTFKISKGNAHVKGYLSETPLEWDAASKTDRGQQLNVSVNAGFAQVWLIGNYAGTEPMAELIVTAQVKGKTTASVSFTEHVWALNTAFSLHQMSGNGQQLKPGDPIQPLKVKLEVRSTHHGVPHEWLKWTNNNPHDLRFRLIDMLSDSYHKEDDQTVWTRTDADGLAHAPALERIGDQTK